jgi:6-phosphogluconolactonase (cycloisomerase 2 family)
MRAIHLSATSVLTLALISCGGGGGGSSAPPPTPTFTVGGNVTGLTAPTLVLQLNGGDDTPLTSSTTFTFSTPVASGAKYTVTVKTQPLGLTCTITNGTGTMGGANLANVAVACGIASYDVSVTVRGLPIGQSVTFLNNGVEALARNLNGTASFATPIQYKQPYAVTVSAAPQQSTCALTGVTFGPVTGPMDVVFDCPHFAYVTNLSDGTLSTYQVDNATGGVRVSSTNPVSTFASPYLIITNPSQSFAYLTSGVPAGIGIDVYGVDLTTGALTRNTSGPFSTGIQSLGLAFDPSGTYAIESNFAGGTISVFTTDSNGGLTPVAGPYAAGQDPGVVAIAATANGNYVYVPSGKGSTLYGYAIGSGGALTLTPGPVTAVPVSAAGLAGIAVDPSAKFVYVGGINSATVFGYSIASNGALSPIAGNPFGAGANPSSVTIHPNGKFLYVANYGSQNVSGYTINPSSGVLTPMAASPYASGINPQSVTIGPTGEYAYVVNTRHSVGGAGSVSVFAINPTSGVLAEVTGSPFAAGTNPQTMVLR